MKRYRLIKTGNGVKKELDDRKNTDFDEYTLEISPNWTSDLNGNPVAILVKAEHIDDSVEENELFKYESLWTNYQISEEESVFGPIDLLNNNKNICIFQEFQEGENIYINKVINSDSKININISRKYDGIIKFILTPIMSYGPLDNLTKSFSIDQSKIASGEILLSKWNYFISKEQSIVTKTSNSTTSKSKDTKVVKTTKKTVKTSESNNSNTSTDTDDTSQNSNNQTIDSEQITETTTTETSSTVYDNEPETYITYKYNINLTYGFDSYMFDNQLIYEGRHHIHFYDVSKLNLDYILDGVDTIDKLKSILNNNELQPDHIESISKEVIGGGNHTIQYRLDTSECKLQPNKLYLAIINLETIVEDIVNPHYDYRYLYTNEVFNEYFNDNEDFENLSIVIDPQLNIEYNQKIKTTYSTTENNDCTIKYLNDNLRWISDDPGESEFTFTFEAQINNKPSKIEVYYNNMGFDSKYNLNLTNSTSESEKVDEIELYYDDTFNQDYNNSVIQTESDYDKIDKLQHNELAKPLIFKKRYTFKINYQTRQDSILIGAIKTNLLNTTNSVNQYKLYLSELNCLSNTMMTEPDSIFTVGIHNDGDDEDESWYGEGGIISEGYTHTISKEYDDTLGYNENNELDTSIYSSESYSYYYYYLKHSTEYLKQFGQEKDDISETFYNYMNSDDSPKEIGKSLETRSLAPLLFVTSGYSADDANKDTTCVYAAIEQFKAPSQPANGNVVIEQDDEEEEKNNFNKEHPYWFIDWTAVNAFNLSSFIGTFMLKYSTKYGTAKYTTTNNYFMMFPTDNGIIGAFYLEDLKRSKEYKMQTFSKSNNPKKVDYSWNAYQNSNIIDPYRHTPPKVEQTVEVTNENSNPNLISRGYSIGDLLATQLAQFAVINEYTIPQETNTSVYCLSDEDKQLMLNLDKEQIVYKRIYSIPLQGNVFNKLNTNLTFNGIKLSNLNQKLPSKNLVLGTFKDDSPLQYSEQLVLNPLSSLIPDFNESVYMVEITPYGEVSLYPKQSSSLSNALYYWNDTKKSYEIYNSDVMVDLYKYGKFSKFTYVGSSTEVFNAEFNQNNYNILPEEDDILEGFIKFHPLTDEKNVDFLVKHRVSCPLNYNPRYGLYTNSTFKKESEMRFYFKEAPHSSESNDSKRKQKDQIAYRSITKLAPPPHTEAFSDGVTLYVDPKHRI